MERSMYTRFGNSLFGIATLGFATLGLLCFPGNPKPPAKNDGDWRLLDPITYENLTVFPVVSSSGYDTGGFLTLEEGLSRGEVIVREQGAETMIRDRDGRSVRPAVQNYGGPSVNQLVLVNRGKQPLLLLAGELVSGGKQDRIIAKDRIVPPGADPLPLDVFCVEHGRWSSGAQFSAAKTIVHPSVREQAALKKSQTDVWDAVTRGSTASPGVAGGMPAAAPRVTQSELAEAVTVDAPTQSYSKIYSSHRVGASVDGVVSEMQRRFRRETSGLKVNASWASWWRMAGK